MLSAGTPVLSAIAAEAASAIVQIAASHITVPPIGVDTRPMMLPRCNRIEKAKQKQIMSSVAAATSFKIKVTPKLFIHYIWFRTRSQEKNVRNLLTPNPTRISNIHNRLVSSFIIGWCRTSCAVICYPMGAGVATLQA